MGGKTSTSTQSVSIPPEVLARYNAVNARAEQVAATPFQAYPGQFVAGLTPTQQAGISATSAASQAAQPYYGMGAGLTLAGAQDVGPLTRGQIGYYESPYTEAVAAPTYAALRQQQGQELAQQQAQAIRSGAAFGERSGLERANLQRQQALGTAQALAPIYQQGYGQAVQTAMGQQGVVAQDLARRMQAGQQIAGLGTGAQQAALQGAQAQLAAGTAEQQTQQADLTARYQQFLQERGYPFQVAQFLANIAMGTGALSGSTTTTTQPAPFFSDKRLKHDAHRIGETDDGLPIYSFKYNGDDRTQIGLMAQDVEKRKPEAVGLAPAADGNLYKTVDYEKATRKGRDLGGPVNEDEDYYNYGESMGGAVDIGSALEGFARGGYAVGGGSGLISSDDWKALLANIGKPIGAYGQDQALGKGAPFASQSYIDPGKVQGPGKLATAGGLPSQSQKAGLSQAMDIGKQAQQTYQMGKGLLVGSAPTKDDPEGASGLLGGQGKLSGKNVFQQAKDWWNTPAEGAATGGLIVPRHAYEDGGDVIPGVEDEDTQMPAGEVNPAGVPSSGFAEGVLESGKRSNDLAVAKGGPGGGGQSGASGILGAAKDVAGLYGLGKGLYSMASGAGSFLAGLPFFVAHGGAINPYAYGGLVPREHHQAGEEVGTDTAPVSLFERPVERREEPAPQQERGLAVREEAPRGNFNDALRRTLQFEGGYTVDTGGPTMKGISSRANPDVDLDRVAKDPEYTANIYKTRYWDPIGADKMEPRMAQVAFDTAVNLGVGRTQQLLKQAEGDPEKLLALRQQHYNDLIARDPETYGKYGRGWSNRVQTLAKEAGLAVPEMAAPPSGSARRPGYGLSLPETYSGVPARQASLGDVAGEVLPKGIPTESSFWVPALGFLGSMLSSRSPFLGAAIGEGLVGGVSAYQAEKKQQMELARDLRAMFDERFVEGKIPSDPATYGANAGKRGFWDKKSQSWFTPEQVNDGKRGMARDLGIPPSYLGVPRAPTRPLTPVEAQRQPQEAQPSATTQTPATTAETPATTAGAPATTTAAPDQTQQKQQQIVSVVGTDKPQDVLEMGPAQLINRIKEGGDSAYVAAGLTGTNDPRPLERELTTVRNRIEEVRRSEVPGSEAELARLTTAAAELDKRIGEKYQLGIAKQLEINQEDLKMKSMELKDYRAEVMKRQQQYQTTRQSFVELADLFSKFMANRTAPWKAELQSWAKGFGLEGVLPEGWDTGSFDKAIKLAYEAAFKKVADSSMVRAPATSLREANLTVPEPSRDPAALFSIIGGTIGEMDFVHSRDRAFMGSKSRDPVGFNYEYEGKTDVVPFKAAAYSEIPFSRGMSQSEEREAMRRYKFIPKSVDPETVGEVRYMGNIGIVRRIDPETNKAEYYYFKKGRQ